MAVILMLINVAVYLWVSGQRAEFGTGAVATRPDVNLEGMRVLSETGSALPSGNASGPRQEAADVAIEPSLIDADSLAGNASDPESPPTQDIGATSEPMCFRVGPFREGEAWKSAKSWVDGNDLTYRVTSEQRDLKAVRVFLGPFPPAELGPVLATLKQKGVEYFVYQADDGSTRVSLGYFTQQELVTKFINYLKSQDIVASSRPEYRRLGPFYWMEIGPGPVDATTITGRNWNESGVSVSKISCPSVFFTEPIASGLVSRV